MLKKIAHILFALLILLVSAGMTISKHYCGTSLQSISVNVTPYNCCESPQGCCHNESLTIKIEDDFVVATDNLDFNGFAITLPATNEIIQSEILVKESFNLLSWEGPPPKIQTVLSKIQVYLL